MVTCEFKLLTKCYLQPEYNQSFTLSINRNHRSFRRVVTSKGLKLELLHKGWVTDWSARSHTARPHGWSRILKKKVKRDTIILSLTNWAALCQRSNVVWRWRRCVSQRFPAERQANRGGSGEAGQTGVTEWNQGNCRGGRRLVLTKN